MIRRQAFEILDQAWCPAWLHRGVTEFIQFTSGNGEVYLRAVGRLEEALERTGCLRVVDIGSGSGGPWRRLDDKWTRDAKERPRVLLTDLDPDDAFSAQMERRIAGRERFELCRRPVAAEDVPDDLPGFLTFFSVFHHLPPDRAARVLARAVASRRGIAVFEMTHRSLRCVLGMLLTPLAALVLTPLIRPFSLTRLVFTYLLPIIPLAATFDGVVSALRGYTPSELLSMARAASGDDYVWEAGEAGTAPPLFTPVTYLIGYPKSGACGSPVSPARLDTASDERPLKLDPNAVG